MLKITAPNQALMMCSRNAEPPDTHPPLMCQANVKLPYMTGELSSE